LEVEGVERGLVLKLLEAGARGVVFIHSSQTVLKQCAVQIMTRRRVGVIRRNLMKRLVDLLVQRMGDSGLGNELSLVLGGVPNGLVRMNTIEESHLGAGGDQLKNSIVVEAKGIFRRARTSLCKQAVERLLMAAKSRLDPGFEGLSRKAGGPGMDRKLVHGWPLLTVNVLHRG